MPLLSTTTPSRSALRPACRVVFGAQAAALSSADPHALGVALPVLAGLAEECLFASADAFKTVDRFHVFRRDGQIAGFAIAPSEQELEAAAADLYRQLFEVARDFHLQRIWNYVPAINAVPDRLENYRRFCRGRSVAFERQFGRNFEQRLPAASAVGAIGGPLALAFLGGSVVPRHFENPRQIPAFHYPPQYGPRAPSFSRATLVHDPAGRKQLFISGTAAIRGHATVAPDDLLEQLACTVENLGIIAETAGAGADVGRAEEWQRHFKIYLRHASDLGPARAYLQQSLLRPADQVSYLRADLCRADLLVEIEAVLTK